MIRVVTVGALLCVLVLVLYLPSAHPTERFLAQIRTEHRAIEKLWGNARAVRILDRALGLQGAAREATPVMPAVDSSASAGVDNAVAREMASVNHRLLGSSYFRAIDALVLLAALRLSAMLEWLPWLAAFVVAALFDGAIERVIKSKEFLHHDPERFALFASMAILLCCATVVAMVVPIAVHPLTSPVVVVALAALTGRSLAHFHRRG